MKGIALAMLAALAVATPTAGKAQHDVSAPEFTLKDETGKTVDLKKLKGKVVVVNFWATWCGPCKAEIPGMVKIYDKYKSKGLEIVGISLDQGGWDDVRPFLQKIRVSYPVVLGNQQVADDYGGISAIPTTFVVDRKGKVVEKHLGYLSPEEFEQKIKALL